MGHPESPKARTRSALLFIFAVIALMAFAYVLLR
jgi:hypothetical protein